MWVVPAYPAQTNSKQQITFLIERQTLHFNLAKLRFSCQAHLGILAHREAHIVARAKRTTSLAMAEFFWLTPGKGSLS